MIHVLHLALAPPQGNFVTFLESLSPLICTKMKVEFSPWQLCHIFGVFVTYNLYKIWPLKPFSVHFTTQFHLESVDCRQSNVAKKIMEFS